MNANTKKIVLVSSSLLVLGGIAFYLYKRKKENSSGGVIEETPTPPPTTNTAPSTNVVAQTNVQPSDVLAFQKYANSKGWSPKLVEDGIYGSKTGAAYSQLGKAYESGLNKGIPTDTAKRTPVNSLMVSSPEKIVGKTVYAINAGSTIYDISNKPVGRTRKDEKIGMVTSAKRTTSGDYILTGKTSLGGYFNIPSNAVYYLA